MARMFANRELINSFILVSEFNGKDFGIKSDSELFKFLEKDILKSLENKSKIERSTAEKTTEGFRISGKLIDMEHNIERELYGYYVKKPVVAYVIGAIGKEDDAREIKDAIDNAVSVAEEMCKA